MKKKTTKPKKTPVTPPPEPTPKDDLAEWVKEFQARLDRLKEELGDVDVSGIFTDLPTKANEGERNT